MMKSSRQYSILTFCWYQIDPLLTTAVPTIPVVEIEEINEEELPPLID
jgi:hypothetical protein